MKTEDCQKIIAEKLRNLADNIESGKTTVVSLNFENHYDSIFIVESGLFEHILTGDSMVKIRVK